MESSSLPSSSSSSSNSDSGAHLADASSNKNMNRMLTNLMAEAVGSNGGSGDTSSLSVSVVNIDTINSPLPMDTDVQKSDRKRSAELIGEEMRSKVLAVDPTHSKNNLSNNVSESHLDASASTSAKTRNVSINKYSKNDIPPFVIYVYSDKSTPTHFSVLSRVVSESIRSDILFIKRLGAGKAIIEAKTADAANRLISNPVFDKNGLHSTL
ncbi:PREDICTED: uncharacterized serine-rich protein C215.13-like [Trachymyrmex septentrionalis]|uniref:uncharacterized serine-rich protein C215.13-like n=1 Tax=Trachymyrmex septentrionalis TaxID=34720 RepID=UPI00084ED4C3|nr:PREDICTED: uncharacterized serine-rich protein C215.13-like [Trachymyrmex septentrionalis]